MAQKSADHGFELYDKLVSLEARMETLKDQVDALFAERDNYKKLWMDVIGEKIALVKQRQDLQVKLQMAEKKIKELTPA